MQKKNEPKVTQSNNAFVEKLQALAGEQHVLMEQSIFPEWFGGLNTAIANNALPVVLWLSLMIALLVFVVFFKFFFILEGRLI